MSLLKEEDFYGKILDAYSTIKCKDQFDIWRWRFYANIIRKLNRMGDRLENVLTNSILVLEGLGRDPEPRGVDIKELPEAEREDALNSLQEFIN